MAGKIQVTHNGKVIGSMTLFDCEPSFELLHAIFPGPLRITHDYKTDAWFADLADAPAPMLAD